jgi:hypothetical protein
MKKFNLLLLLIGINFTSYAMESIENRQENLISRLLNQQVQQSISIEHSVNALVKRYPEKIDIILKLAINNYPTKYKEIILGTIHAEPVLSAVVVAAVLQAQIASCAEVVKIAINAEPAYANEIILAASQNSIDPIQDIVRVAVSTEPFIYDSLISNANADDNSIANIFLGIVKALPDQVVNLVKKTLHLFPNVGANVVENAVYSTPKEFNQDIINAAMNAGVKKEIAIAAAIKGGASEAELAKL